mmetsp:Transcript_3240/g.6048  ORF Transcript_3240/g.6048 Transcript_3240/m.6048 type:complete len:348 (+) Transcript_3240:62-1105(+)|eukprot:CAMPEP_0176477246 /NCGR_PEP_ID=MMETSP0200_2-20121128/510_1 /TAXON_ID=947934 /ORGANISM="Chaetoceros sp., Strain GSL56" /LENGTH=347 /DNA_ID=CAMNT_0017873023 /DNA_START=17 /DNA_END=1060 /DNA_ORIENTATION=+
MAMASTLSTESPPFSPRPMTMVNQSPAQYRSMSRSTSPLSNSSAAEGNSNAIARHTFQYKGETLEIRNVWAENVEEEMAKIRELIETHPYVAMDTEFPGVVARPVSETYSPDYHYKSLKVNVDLLKIIQLGLSFADENGNFAKGCPCWQFNFKFNLNDDMFAQDSIDLLVSSGISFDDHASRGIDPLHFGELLMVSGLVLDNRVRWVSFHSGYDYGYLLKLLTAQELPNDEKGFFDTLKLYFPTIYDIKYMTSLCDGHFGGLQKLADALSCQRIGVEHQAGSDSLLTMTTYFALARAKFMNGEGIDDSKYKNELYGYGSNHTVRKGNAHAQMHLSHSSSALSVGNSD